MTPYILIIAGTLSMISGVVLLVRQKAAGQPTPVTGQGITAPQADGQPEKQINGDADPATQPHTVIERVVYMPAPTNGQAARSDASGDEESGPSAVEKGAAFEKWVVDQTNRRFWKMLEWQGDKFHKGVYAESNRNPDMLFQVAVGTERHKLSLECKWRSRFNQEGRLHWATEEQIAIYNKYAADRNVPVFAVIGVGGSPSLPDEVYIVPLKALKYPDASRDYLRSFRQTKGGYFFYDFDRKQLSLHAREASGV